MKTYVFKNTKTLLIVLTLSFFTNFVFAQNNNQTPFTVKGIVNSELGPLNSVSIYLKNSNEGTVSKKDGTFTFPKELKAGDVLIFSYLGYEKQTIVLKSNSTFLDVFMKEAPVDILSALNTNKPYKSKRPKSN